MATDSKISALPANPGVTPNDLVEIVDTSNTTNNATGENTKAQVAALVSGLPPVGAAGGAHAAGLVPDPGATAHATPYILGDDGTFHQIGGSAVSYAGGIYTITAGTGGSATPGGSNGQIQYNNAGGFGGLAAVPVANGGTNLTALGTALQVLRVNAAGTGLEYAAPSGGGGTPGGTNGQIQVNSSGAFGGADLTTLLDALAGSPVQGSLFFRDSAAWNDLAPGTIGQAPLSGGAGANPAFAGICRPIWSGGGAGTPITNTTTETSIFAGVAASFGSLTFPANTLRAGQILRFPIMGTINTTGSVTLTVKVKLGGVTILQCTTGSLTTTSGAAAFIFDGVYLNHIEIQTIGASGTALGFGRFSMLAGGTATNMTSTGVATIPPTAVTINTTISNLFDITFQWSAAASAHTANYLCGAVYLDG